MSTEESPKKTNFQAPYTTSILAKSPPRGQSKRDKSLINAINRRQLSKSLEIREKSGYTGDLGIFILANLQASLEVA
ncbi:hypothetical protein [Anabaena azotica]|uniref:CpcA n=1 Tax=Anabaena azotica FACHB-119 TaxID=947527 RepID=A0ABR8DDK7_9NOST|nr:hypothetical protein [Anabaena azotica]MBD2505320.1 hypothetical protein [Anabaena azotica FACHB-119]